MDAISIVIIVTVLSLSSALIYLFKSDFERRKRAYFATTTTSNTNGNNNSQQPNHIITKKQQPSKSAKQPQVQGPKQNGNNIQQSVAIRNATSKPQVPLQPSADTSKSNRKQQLLLAPTSSEGEPSPDELDTSVVALGVIKSKLNAFPGFPSAQESSGMSKKALRKLKQTSGNSSSANYSSEQLFRIIAATNLTREEIELAVETLLNKIELGESNASSPTSDWRQPKNDPMQKLKIQLRDSELALSSETQNHEQTRMRLVELKGELLVERNSTNVAKEELGKLRKEFNVLSLALEQARTDLSKQQLIQKQIRDENRQLISELEQSNSQLQSLMGSLAVKEADSVKFRNELEEKINQLRSYELSSQSMAETIGDLENKLRSMEHQMDQLRSNKHHDEYEACAKISDLEADKATLEKVIKDRLSRFAELAETNKMLEKSVKELQVINSRQEDMLTRLRDERHVNEASMKRTLCEMDKELKELQSKLSLSSNGSAAYRKDGSPTSELSEQDVHALVERANEREQKLSSELNQLREGLSVLLPKGSIKASDIRVAADDWVQQYLSAVRQLSLTVDELRATTKSNGSSNHSVESSPVKVVANGSSSSSSRVGSPNGRSSRGATGSPNDERKKVMETKLLELSDLSSSSQSSVLTSDSEEFQQNHRDLSMNQQDYEHRIKELTTTRNKLEAQIKYGLDSLRMEQEKVRVLEAELDRMRKPS